MTIWVLLTKVDNETHVYGVYEDNDKALREEDKLIKDSIDAWIEEAYL